MYNNLFSIGGFTVHGYGLMIAIGIVAAYLVAEKRAKSRGLDEDVLFNTTILAVIGGILGAKLLYLIINIKDIIANPAILKDFSNGFVVYGGIILGTAFGVGYTIFKKVSTAEFADLIMPSVALAQAFGRLGCFLAGCCYGVETDSPFSIVFTNSDFAPNNVHLVPTQLISSGLDFLNFFVLVMIARKNKKPGRVAILYLCFYSIGRFCLEFFRGDLVRGSVGILSTSQFISVIVAILSFIALALSFRKTKDQNIEA